MSKVISFITNKKVLMWIGFIVVIVGVYFFAKSDSIKTIPVKEVTLEQKVVEKTISATGSVAALDEAILSFNAMGKIQNLNVQEGDNVSKGDLLANLDYTTTSQAVQVARDSRDIALRDKELFISKYLYNKSAVGGNKEYDISLRKHDELISQAEANLASTQSQVRNSFIYSPLTGIVYSLTKSEGENASIGEPILKVADLANLVFEVELDQEDYGLVKKDQRVTVELDAYNNEKLTGYVYDLPLYANGGSAARFKVKIIFDENSSVKPLLGMTGDVHIVIAETGSPVDALFYDQVFTDEDDSYYVWVLDNGLINKQNVDIGLEGDVYYELKNKPALPIIVGLNSDIVVKDGYKAKLSK